MLNQLFKRNKNFTRHLSSDEKGAGFSLIEALIGILLIVVVFSGIVGAFQLGLRVVAQSKARITALALANKRIEEIRNLSYEDVGTIGGIPPGVIPQSENQVLNNIDFTITTTILNIDDPFDGTVPNDPIPADYKRTKVRVSWPGIVGGETFLITDIVPKGIESTLGGGTLLIIVLDASGLGVSQASVGVLNDEVEPPIDASYLTDDYGNLVLAGAPTSTEAYQITATKSGYSNGRTYGREEITNPLKPHSSVYEGDLTEISFSIDKTSDFLIETRAQESFDDEFNNFSKTSEYVDLEIEEGQVRLREIASYVSSGYLLSLEIAPAGLVNWESCVFEDVEPEHTIIKYHVYAATNTSWFLITEEDLPFNTVGFEESPIDLSGLDTSEYPKLKLRADFSTLDPNTTPYLDEWHVYYNTPLIPDIEFHLRGDKILGTDIEGKPVYKYSEIHQTGGDGRLNLTGLEWDSYNFYETENTIMDLLRVFPSNPVDLFPDQSITVGLYLKAENSLLVTALDSSTAEPIFGANVRLYNQEIGYDKNLPTDENGKAYFLPLEAATYDLGVEAVGYQPYSTSIWISGSETKTIELEEE